MSDDTVTIRRCGPDDWRALRSIRLESLADTPDAYGSTFAESSTWSDKRWKIAASQWLYILAERDDRIVGMVSGGINDSHPGRRWIYGMYVTPTERGTETAVRLIEAVAQWASDLGAAELYLNVTSSVARARAFYDKIGFRPTGETCTMDRDPSLTLVTMVRDLA